MSFSSLWLMLEKLRELFCRAWDTSLVLVAVPLFGCFLLAILLITRLNGTSAVSNYLILNRTGSPKPPPGTACRNSLSRT